jgi:hypothetical protein
MHQSKVPLTAWFWATYVLAAQPDGMSALQLQRELGLGSYRTAWLLCSKLRLSMVEPDRALLSGAVEIGRSEIRYRGKSGCAPGSSKTRCRITIIGAIEVKGLRLGRLRLGTLSEVSPACLSGFLAANLAPDAIAKIGTWAGCPNSLNIDCSSHLTLTADDNLHWIKRVFAELQSWILAVPHGLRCEHLQSYLDEFAFRFSRRHARDAAFRSLLGIAAAHLPVSLETLVVRDPGANSRAAGSVGPQSRNGYAT